MKTVPETIPYERFSNKEYMSFARISLPAQTLIPKTGVLHPPSWVVKFGLINCQNKKEKKDKLE